MAIRSVRFPVWRAMLASLVLCTAVTARAQDASEDATDPPDRVARLAWLSGDAGLLPEGARDWGQADLNRPVTTGDRLATGDDARLELDFGGAVARLDGGTDAGVLALDQDVAQLELTQGTMELSVRTVAEGQSYEIDTPTVAVVLDSPGTVRIDIGRDGRDTRVSLFDGRARAYGENDARRELAAGRRYDFVDASLEAVALEDLDGSDAFDDWWQERDRRYADAAANRYVDEEVVGAEDLDRYGTWRDTAGYGHVWYPDHVDAGWAPYRDGRWAWVDPWGWTWVDAAPWGFAPYHYGRWVWAGGGWGWLPGPLGVRPVYAPALVAFIGGSWSLGLGNVPVGWVPLGPGEIYRPWYHHGRRYYRQVNLANLHHHDPRVRQRLDHEWFEHHRHVPVRPEHLHDMRGFTAVPAHAFGGPGGVRGHRITVDPTRLRHAEVVAHPPVREPPPGARVIPRPPRAGPLPLGGFRHPVVARHRPDRAAPVHVTGMAAGQRPAPPLRVRPTEPRPTERGDGLPPVASLPRFHAVAAGRAPPPSAGYVQRHGGIRPRAVAPDPVRHAVGRATPYPARGLPRVERLQAVHEAPPRPRASGEPRPAAAARYAPRARGVAAPPPRPAPRPAPPVMSRPPPLRAAPPVPTAPRAHPATAPARPARAAAAHPQPPRSRDGAAPRFGDH